MIEKVISGGQTGADQAGWRAAKRCGIATGGWMPKGFLTLDGRRPEFAGLYGAREHPSHGWVARTASNIFDADDTLIFNWPFKQSKGTRLAIEMCRREFKYFQVINHEYTWTPRAVAARLSKNGTRILNVAGDRETDPPRIGEWVEEYLVEVFRLLGHPPSNPAT